MKRFKFLTLTFLVFSCSQVSAQKDLPDGIILLEPGEEITLEGGRFYQLTQILVQHEGAVGTSVDGANKYKFCGELMFADLNARVIRIDETVFHFDRIAPAAMDIITNDLPMWLAPGTKLCLPDNHKSSKAIISYWNQP